MQASPSTKQKRSRPSAFLSARTVPLRVLFVASEVEPFRKSGGLGDVAGSLPKALKRRGIDVRVVMPLYQGIRLSELERLEGVLEVPMYYGTGRGAVRLGHLPASDVPIYFVEHHGYFDRPHIYGPPGHPYSDNLERFTFFSRASLELANALGFEPHVVHAHDWPTALVPAYIDIVDWQTPLHRAASVYTIHNLAYQGQFDGAGFFITGLAGQHYEPGEFEHFGEINLMKGALQHSTLLSTVSPSYAQEIQRSEHGFGLDGVLASRRNDLFGILNGIDTDDWDPARDPHIPYHYDARDLSGKKACKAALQREMHLSERADVPIFGVMSRLTPQKGLDVLAEALETLLGWNLQMVLLGNGDHDAERFFAEVSRRRSDKFSARIGYDNALAHRIEAGCDFLILPSRFEPCGLNQLYSMRYGTLPIVRATGGLADTVTNYNETTAQGTGFVFHTLDAESLANTIGWALATFFNRHQDLETMQRRAMEEDLSWSRPAEQYERLYLDACQRRRRELSKRTEWEEQSPVPGTLMARKQG